MRCYTRNMCAKRLQTSLTVLVDFVLKLASIRYLTQTAKANNGTALPVMTSPLYEPHLPLETQKLQKCPHLH